MMETPAMYRTPAPAAVQSAGRAWAESIGAFAAESEVPWGGVRHEAREALAALPVPHRRLERWKYTPVQSVFAGSESAGGVEVEVGVEAVPGLDAYRMVWRDGVFDAGASNPPVVDGLVCMPASRLSGAHVAVAGAPVHRTDWMAALNAACAEDGLVLVAEPGLVLDRPVLVHHIVTPGSRATCLRHVVQLGAAAEVRAVVWTTAAAGAAGFHQVVTTAEVGPQARFVVDKAIDGQPGLHVHALELIDVLEAGRVDVTTAVFGGSWVRCEPHVRLLGREAHATLNGLSLPGGGERNDAYTTIDHVVADCTSSETYRSAVHGGGVNTFNGKVFVRLDAQKTDAYQHNANLLIGSGGTVNAKPELEIYADDVKCSHGCTVGALDEQAVFYFRSRGIARTEAEAMLVQAFLAEACGEVGAEEFRTEVERRFAEKPVA
jgi:Fe-S cluster assembly protein SufD